MRTDTGKKSMSIYTVYTPNGDWRGICAHSPHGAKVVVWHLTHGRTGFGEMTVEREGAR